MRIRTLLIIVLIVAISTPNTSQPIMVHSNISQQVGGILVPDQITEPGLVFPWDSVEDNTGYLIYDTNTMKVEAQYVYIQNAEVYHFKIYDQTPTKIIDAADSILPTDKLTLTMDFDNNQVESQGDYKFVLRLGTSNSKHYVGVFDGEKYVYGESDNEFIEKTFYNQSLLMWDITIQFAMFLTDIKPSEKQSMALSYEDYTPYGISSDSGFDNVPNYSLEENIGADLYYSIIFPSLDVSITVSRNIQSVLVPPTSPFVKVNFRVSSQTPLTKFKFTEASPLDVSLNSAVVSGEHGSKSQNQNTVQFNLDKVDGVAEFELKYRLEIPKDTEQKLYTWPPVQVQYRDFLGVDVKLEFNLDTVVMVTDNPEQVQFDDLGNIVTETDTELQVNFSEDRIDIFAIFVQILSLLLGAVALLVAIKGSSMVIISRNIRRKFQAKSTELVYDIVRAMKGTDKEYLSVFMRRGLQDIEEYSDSLSRFRINNPSSIDVVQYHFGKFKKRMLERVEIFFSENERYALLRDYIIEKD